MKGERLAKKKRGERGGGGGGGERVPFGPGRGISFRIHAVRTTGNGVDRSIAGGCGGGGRKDPRGERMAGEGGGRGDTLISGKIYRRFPRVPRIVRPGVDLLCR